MPQSFFKLYLYDLTYRILLYHRTGKRLYFSNFFLLRQIGHIMRVRAVSKYGCDISYHCTLGKNLRFPHPLGIVIGKGVRVGDNVKIFQQVTLGSHGKSREMTYPVIGDNVTIFAGSKIIGGVNIGNNSVIGANSVVNKDVPPNSVAYGIPCKIKPQS